MQLSTVLEKCVDISKLSIKDAKARRIFILADGRRTLDQIFNLCMIDEAEGIALTEILLDGGFLKNTSGEKVSAAKTFQVSPAREPLDESFIADITSELAKYVGPVASIVMSDVMEQSQGPGANNRRLLVERAAKQIDNRDDRENFLANLKNLMK